MIFSIWIGTKPPPLALECMAANEERHGLTLIASENWIGAMEFIPIGSVIESALRDPRCRALWDAFPQPEFRSDVLRVWWLMQNPDAVYLDSDCILHTLPPRVDSVIVPGIQDRMKKSAAHFGGELVMDEVRNSTGGFVDVFAIFGNGDASFFDSWLTRWASKWARRGGIGDALIYEPVTLSILPESCYTHFFSTSKNKHYKPVLSLTPIKGIKMTTLADFKSNFFDLQRQQANLLETLLNEIVALNQKVKDLTPEPKPEKKAK